MISRSLFTLIIGIFSFTSGANPTHSCKETVQKFILLNGGLDIYSADLETLSSEELQKLNLNYKDYENLELNSSTLTHREFYFWINHGNYKQAIDVLDGMYGRMRANFIAHENLKIEHPFLKESQWDTIKVFQNKISQNRLTAQDKRDLESLGSQFEKPYIGLLNELRKQMILNLPLNRFWIDDIPKNKEFLLYKTPAIQSSDKSENKKTIITKPMSATLMRDPDGIDYAYGEIFEFNESDDKKSSYKRDSIKFSTKIIDGKCYVIPKQFNLKFFSGKDIIVKNLSKESCEKILSQMKKQARIPSSVMFENDGMDPNHFDNTDKISLVLNVCKEMKDIIAPSPQNNEEKKPTSSNTKTSKQ